MMLNNYQGLKSGTLITAEDINGILGIDHESRMLVVPTESWATNDHALHLGLNSTQILAALEKFGLIAHRWSARSGEGVSFRDFLYGFIESGYPALLVFTVGAIQHVVTVVGHTLNSDSWRPTALNSYAGRVVPRKPYLSTLDWVDDFIVHDDNFGMNFCLPAHSFHPDGYPDPTDNFAPVQVIGVYPNTIPVKALGNQVERVAFSVLLSLFPEYTKGALFALNCYYVNHIYSKLRSGTIVLRASLVNRNQYLDHLRTNTDNAGDFYDKEEKDLIEAILSEYQLFWLVEVTEPDLYIGNKSKVIDILIDPSMDLVKRSTEGGTYGVLMIRFPGSLFIPDTAKRAVYTPVDLPHVQSHFPLFTLDGTRPLRTVW